MLPTPPCFHVSSSAPSPFVFSSSYRSTHFLDQDNKLQGQQCFRIKGGGVGFSSSLSVLRHVFFVHSDLLRVTGIDCWDSQEIFISFLDFLQEIPLPFLLSECLRTDVAQDESRGGGATLLEVMFYATPKKTPL